MTPHFDGLAVAIVTFLIIGIFHPIVIKVEYHFGTRCWPAFALAGTLVLTAALFVQSLFISSLLGVLACSLFWSILELFEQKKRVEKGWFPKNPNRP